ncbi:hypothetical protein NEIRO03_2711, partial [Nematocida sp. AWRm78]
YSVEIPALNLNDLLYVPVPLCKKLSLTEMCIVLRISKSILLADSKGQVKDLSRIDYFKYSKSIRVLGSSKAQSKFEVVEVDGYHKSNKSNKSNQSTSDNQGHIRSTSNDRGISSAGAGMTGISTSSACMSNDSGTSSASMTSACMSMSNNQGHIRSTSSASNNSISGTSMPGACMTNNSMTNNSMPGTGTSMPSMPSTSMPSTGACMPITTRTSGIHLNFGRNMVYDVLLLKSDGELVNTKTLVKGLVPGDSVIGYDLMNLNTNLDIEGSIVLLKKESEITSKWKIKRICGGYQTES